MFSNVAYAEPTDGQAFSAEHKALRALFKQIPGLDDLEDAFDDIPQHCDATGTNVAMQIDPNDGSILTHTCDQGTNGYDLQPRFDAPVNALNFGDELTMVRRVFNEMDYLDALEIDSECAGDFGTRYLIRFNSSIINTGNEPFVLGSAICTDDPNDPRLSDPDSGITIYDPNCVNMFPPQDEHVELFLPHFHFHTHLYQYTLINENTGEESKRPVKPTFTSRSKFSKIALFNCSLTKKA